MTPEAKKSLATTIRALRARLLADSHAAMTPRYLVAVRAIKKIDQQARKAESP